MPKILRIKAMPCNARLCWTHGLALSACYGIWAWLSRHGQGLGLSDFFLTAALAFAVYIRAYKTFDGLIKAEAILFWAVVFRLIGGWGEPLFEDDFYRYLWDGYRFAADGTPYGTPPEAFFSDPAVPRAFQPILGQINHPDIPTLYGPTFEYLFLLAYRLAPAHLWPLKVLLIGGDILLIVLLLRIAGPRNTLLYAWNPLVVKEIAFTAHPDAMIPLLSIGAWCLGRHGRNLAAGLLLAMAAGAKASAWLLVPFLLVGLGHAGAAGFAVTYAVLYIPFCLHGATEFAGLQAFAQGFEFNSALFGLAVLFMPPNLGKVVLGVIFLAASAGYFAAYLRQARPRALPRGDCLFGGLLLIAPVINPWYLLWLLPYACVYPSLAAWTASAVLLSAYATGLNLEGAMLGPYEHPLWLRPLEFGAVALAFIRDTMAGPRPRTDAT